MRFIKKHKKIFTVLTAVLLIAVSLGVFVGKAWAAYDTWNSLVELEFRSGVGEGQHSMTDVKTYGGNYTNDVGKIYSDRSHFFDNIRLDTMSRVTYARKVRVASGQRLTIVAAKDDTADAGGSTENAGLQFYWSVGEYDENGNIVFDGGWRSSSGTWTVGVTENGDTGYGKSGYPNGEDISTRQNKVRYVVPIFRWNNGDESVGSGGDSVLIKGQIANMFPVFTMITDPFTYTFNLNGGQVNGSGNVVTMQRLGIENVSVPATPTRPGYVFTGWKITSTGGKQAGKVYDAGQLTEMFTDGKYWSSLFADATFEAQWVQADCFVSYMGNGADNMSDFYRSYNAAYDGNTAENFLFKRTGYTSVSGNTWEIKDQFLNLTGGCDGGGTLPSSGTLTSIRTKCGGRYQCVDISAASYADGANAQIWDCVNGNAQMYAFVFTGFEDGLPYWVIRNNATGKVLDAAIGTGIDGGNNGANIQQWAYHGGDNQKWTLQMAGDGYFYIRSKLDPNLVLDLLYGSTDNGTNLQLCNYYGGDNQQWYLWDNTINLSAEWTSTNYKVDYNADGGTLLDENGNATTDTVRTYEYDRTYDFLKAKRAYTVSYETNGGTAATGEENTNAQAEFNGWNEQLDSNTTHGEVQGSYDWTIGTLNWAAYYNGNPDILNAAGNVYDTIRAIMHYRAFGISENRQFTGASYWLPSVRFKNLTADGGTVNVKADYTNGSVTLPDADKDSEEKDGSIVYYVFEGWYLDAALTNRVGGAGDTYTPAGNVTLYANFTESSSPNNYVVSIEHYLMNTDGTYPDTPHETTSNEYKSGYQLNVVDIVNEYDGYQYNSEKTQAVNGQFPVTVTQNITLKIYYERNKYTVTYDVAENGGNWSDNSTKSVTRDYYWGQDVDLTLTAQKADYDFLGWNTDSSATEAIKSLVMPQEDVTLYALYSGDVTAKFVDSLGVRTVTGTRYNNTQNAIITVPDIRDYDWNGVTSNNTIGWNSNTDINAESARENEITTDTITINCNVTYYAVYSANVMLEYDLNGADESQQPEPVTVTAYTNAYNLTAVCGEKVTLAQAVKHTLEAQEGYIDSYVQTAWVENSLDGKQYATGSEYNLTQNTVMYALWDGEIKPITYTIHFDGNGSTAGEMQDINVKYDEQVTLPDNDFARTTDWGDSTFMGWNRTADTKTIEFSNQDIVSNLSSTDGDVVVLYAIWDDCPEITAKDRYFTLKEAQEGRITVEELLTTATANDLEDGDITDKLTIPNTNDEEWKKFTAAGSATITYKVTDSVGNTSRKTVTVYIADTTPDIKYESSVRSAKYGYVRFISEKYYKNSPEDGGVVENSVWKLPEYAAVLESAMENRRSMTYQTGTMNIFGGLIQYDYTVPGSISCDHVSQLWKFTREDRNEIKDYVREHGLGKYKEQDALNGFMTEFGYCRQQ